MIDIHKEKCKQLKKIRKSMADKLGVNLHQQECTFEGKCSGTCPKCKQEEEILNKAILQRAAVVSVAATMGVGMVGCNTSTNKPNSMLEELKSLEPHKVEKIDTSLSGDVEMVEPPIIDDDIVGGLEVIEDDEIEVDELSGDVEYIDDINIDTNTLSGDVVPIIPF